MSAVPPTEIAGDIATIERIPVVKTILDVVCRTTKLGFAAVARVTQDRWIACAVRDEIAFGLQPGAELEVKSTICDEIRDSDRARPSWNADGTVHARADLLCLPYAGHGSNLTPAKQVSRFQRLVVAMSCSG